MQIHATAIQWHKKGILFIGKSGVGKSTAALLLLDKGAHLVADDQVILTKKANQCVASCPKTIQNKLEVRGVGIVSIKTKKRAAIDFVVNLTADYKAVPRMPDETIWAVEDIVLPSITLCAFDTAFCQRLDAYIKTLSSFCLQKKVKRARSKANKEA